MKESLRNKLEDRDVKLLLDFDGVICPMEFGDNQAMITYWENTPDEVVLDRYLRLDPIEPLVDLMAHRDFENITVITNFVNHGEKEAKQRFIKEKITNKYIDFIFVRYPDSKVPYIMEIMRSENIGPEEIIIIEDTTKNILEVQEKLGIHTVHISSMFNYKRKLVW